MAETCPLCGGGGACWACGGSGIRAGGGTCQMCYDGKCGKCGGDGIVPSEDEYAPVDDDYED